MNSPRQISIELGIDGLSFIATSVSGASVRISPDMAGIQTLLGLCRTADRGGAKPSAGPSAGRFQSPQGGSAFSPGDYSRVCYCGAVVQPFMTRCDTCPGHSGAGKVRKFLEHGKRAEKASLADLGFDDI